MTSQIQPNLSTRGVTWHWLSAWVACSKHALKKVRTQKYGIFILNESNRRSKYPAFKRIFFSYRYWWFAAKLRQRGANQTVSTVYSILGIFENGPVEPGYALNGSHQFSWQFLTFLSVAKKGGHYRKVISTVGAQFISGRYHWQEVAVVERLKREPIYELSPRRKERNHYFPQRLVHCFCHKWKIFIPCVFLAIKKNVNPKKIVSWYS